MRSSWRARYKPTAITLDVFLPDMLGWTVLNQLKRDPATRHIPVQILTVEEERQYGLERGAFSFINKPLTTDGLEQALRSASSSFTEPRVRELLVVEDDPAEQMSIRELIGHDDVEITTGGTGAEALETARASATSTASCSTCACRTCPGSSCSIACSWTRSCSDVPVVVFTGRELSDSEQTRAAHARPRASCSRACSRRSGCWMRRRCSCIA